MKKRGQIYSAYFKYVLIVIITVLIIFFGIKAINKIRAASCNARLIMFEKGLKGSVEEVQSYAGTVNEESIELPCGIERIYFVDLEKNMDKLFASLYEFPLIKDAVKDEVGKNAFLVKDNKVVDSFFIGNIELQKPYYVCSDTRYRGLNLYLGGTGTSTEVINKNCTFDCTFELVEVNDSIAGQIIQEAIDFGCKGCPQGSIEDEIERFKETNKSVKIARRCNCGRKPGQAVVEILIKPEGTLEHFKLIEKIPKDYVNDLGDYIEDIEGGDYNFYKIKSDPLIMWHFDSISEETIVRYTLNTDVFEYCADVLQTVALAVTPESENVIDEDALSALSGDDPLQLNLPDDIVEIRKGQSNHNVFSRPIWHFVNDPDRAIKKEKKESLFKDYTYQISDDGTIYTDTALGAFYYGPNYPTPNPEDYILCLIDLSASKKVNCEVGNDFSEAAATFYIKVTAPDGEEAIDSFTVSPFICAGKSKDECKDLCEWCEECENGKYSSDVPRCVGKGTCSYTDGTDNDGDGFNVECDNDCVDDPSLNPNAKNIYPGNNNPYCDCEPSDDVTTGIEEICDDGKDNDCSGEIDDCKYKLKCTRLVDSDCAAGLNEEGVVFKKCEYYHSRGEARWDWSCGIFTPWRYECYDDWETPCMENPTCINGIEVAGSKTKCQSSATKFKYNYSTVAKRWNYVFNFVADQDCPGKRWKTWGYPIGEGYVCFDDHETSCEADPTYPGGIFLEVVECSKCTDIDNDGYSIEGADCGEIDCDDANPFVNLSSTNPYCDCNPSTAGGITKGTDEDCTDGIDNDCNGIVDDCNTIGEGDRALRCEGEKKVCSQSCDQQDCTKFGSGWSWTGSGGYQPSYCQGQEGNWVCICTYNQWTQCSESPQCPQDTELKEETICCNDANNCPGGACENGRCNFPECELEAAYWDTDSVKEGKEVTLIVRANSGCNGKDVSFEVLEDDIGINQPITPNPSSSTFYFDYTAGGCRTETKWTAKIVPDIVGNPEYFFRAIVDEDNDNEIISKGNGDGNAEILEVTPVLKKLHCINVGEKWSSCHKSCGPVHCGELGTGWTYLGCHKHDCSSSKRQALCSYDAWTVCSINPKCPPNTDEIERKPCCIDNDDCNPGEVCSSGECVVPDCELESAYWDGTFDKIEDWNLPDLGIFRMATVQDGATVNLIVKGENSCKDKQVNFEIWEDDPYVGLDIHMLPDKVGSFSCDNSGCSATATWNSVWQDDWSGDLDPEYSFKANVTGEDEILSRGNAGGNVEILKVVPASDCELESAYWEGDFLKVENWGGSYYDAAYVQAGSEVTFTVKGSIGCNGKTVEVKAKECDLTGVDCNSPPYCSIRQDTIALTNPLALTFTNSNCDSSGCTAQTKWNAEWMFESNQDKEEGNNPEYLFNAEVAGEDVMEMKGNHIKNPRFLRVVKVASLTATITTTSKSVSGGYTYYYYDLVIKESNGIGVTLRHARECFKSIGCKGWDNKDRLVPPNGQYLGSSYWWTTLSYEEYGLEYEGQDNNGNPVSVVSNKLVHPS